MFNIWIWGVVLTFLVQCYFKNAIVDSYIESSEENKAYYEKYGDMLIFIGFTIISVSWPLLLILLIIHLFDENI